MNEDDEIKKFEDEREALYRSQRSKAQEWLNQHWKMDRSCPICGNKSWTITEAVEVRGFEGGNTIVMGGPSFALFQVICTTCAYTHLFNASLAGTLPDQSEYRND